MAVSVNIIVNLQGFIPVLYQNEFYKIGYLLWYGIRTLCIRKIDCFLQGKLAEVHIELPITGF